MEGVEVRTRIARVLFAAAVLVGCGAPDAPGPDADVAVLIHGLAYGPISMRPMGWYLRRRGYRVVILGYPSRAAAISELVDAHLAPALAPYRNTGTPVHFVTHSMGGILLRRYFAVNRFSNLGRVVMLAPPNRGSRVADLLESAWLFERWLGPALGQLGIEPGDAPRRLPGIPGEVGVIAGNRSFLPFFSAILPGPDDGEVTVESARIREMADFMVLPLAHGEIMLNPTVMEATANFLETGRFVRAADK